MKGLCGFKTGGPRGWRQLPTASTGGWVTRTCHTGRGHITLRLWKKGSGQHPLQMIRRAVSSLPNQMPGTSPGGTVTLWGQPKSHYLQWGMGWRLEIPHRREAKPLWAGRWGWWREVEKIWVPTSSEAPQVREQAWDIKVLGAPGAGNENRPPDCSRPCL